MHTLLLDMRRKLNIYKTFRNVILCTFNLLPVPRRSEVLVNFEQILGVPMSEYLPIASNQGSTQLVFTCSKPTIETLKHCVKFVES